MAIATQAQRSVEVFKIHPAILWGTVFASLLLQAFLPIKLPLARLFDFPLLVAIYFAVLRRNKVFAIALGSGMGLLQDALSNGYIGLFGMAKALTAYLAASASIKFDLEQMLARSAVMAVLVVVHGFFLLGLEHVLLEVPRAFLPLNMASGVLVNVGLGLVLFQVFDRFKRSA